MRRTQNACAAALLLLSLVAAAQAVSVSSRSPHSHSSRQSEYKPTHEEILEAEESAAAAAHEAIEDTYKTAVVDVGPPPNDHTADIDPDSLAPRAKDVPDFLVNHTHSQREQERIKLEEHSMINPMSERYLHILEAEEHSLPPAPKSQSAPAEQTKQQQTAHKQQQQQSHQPAHHQSQQHQQKHARPVNRMPPPTPHYRPAPRRYLVTAHHHAKPKHAEAAHHPAVGMSTVVRTVGADGKERQVSTIDTNAGQPQEQPHEQPHHPSPTIAASSTVIRTVGRAADQDADSHPIVSHSDPSNSIQYHADDQTQTHDAPTAQPKDDGKVHEVLMKSPFPISKRAQHHQPHVFSVKESNKKHPAKKKVEHLVATAHWKPHHAHHQTHKQRHSLAETDSEIRPSSMPSRQRTASTAVESNNNAASDDSDASSMPQFRQSTRTKAKLKVRAAPSCQGLPKKMCKPCSGAMPGPAGKVCDDTKEACGDLFCMPMCTKLLWKVGTTADGAEEPLTDEFKDEVESEPVQAALQAHFITRGCVDKLECCDKDRMWDYIEDAAFGSNYGQPVMPIKSCKHNVEDAELSAKMCAACNAAVKVKSEPIDCPDDIKQGPANDDGSFIDIAARYGVPRHVSSKYGVAAAKPFAAQRFGVTLLELGFGSEWSEPRVQKRVEADGSVTFTPFRNERQKLRSKHTYFKHRNANRSDRKMRFIAHRAEVLANARKAQVATRLMLLQEKEKLKRSPPDSARAKFLRDTMKYVRQAEEITSRHEQQLIETQEQMDSPFSGDRVEEEMEELSHIAQHAVPASSSASSTTRIRTTTSSSLPTSPSFLSASDTPVPTRTSGLSSFAEVDSWERSLRSTSRHQADTSSRGFAAAHGKLAVVKPLDVGPPKMKNFWERCKQLEPIVHGMLGGFDADFQGVVCGCLGCCPMVPCFYRTSIQNEDEIESSEDDWE